MSNKRIAGGAFIVFMWFLALTVLGSPGNGARLPVVGSDNNTWGDVLNLYLNSSLGINGTNLTVVSANISNLVSCSSIQSDANGFLSCGVGGGGGSGIVSWLLSSNKFTPNGTGYLVNVSDSALVAKGIQSDNVSTSLVVTGKITGLDLAIGWNNLTDYPVACGAGQFISALADGPTCGTPSTSNLMSWILTQGGKFTPNGTGYLVNVSDSAFVAKGIQSNNISTTLAVVGTLTGTDIALGFSNLTAYPTACPAGQYVSAVGDTLTCVQDNATGGDAPTLQGYNANYFWPNNATQNLNSMFNATINTTKNITVLDSIFLGRNISSVAGSAAILNIQVPCNLIYGNESNWNGCTKYQVNSGSNGGVSSLLEDQNGKIKYNRTGGEFNFSDQAFVANGIQVENASIRNSLKINISDTSQPALLDINGTNGRIMIENLAPVRSTTDVGILFNGSKYGLLSGLYTEVSGLILTYSINDVSSNNVHIPGMFGSLFRMDLRNKSTLGNGADFTIGFTANRTDSQGKRGFIIDLENGDTYMGIENNSRTAIGYVDFLQDAFNQNFKFSVNGSATITGSLSVTGGISGPLGWGNLTLFPPACPAGQFVSTIGDTITCGTPTDLNTKSWLFDGTTFFTNQSSTAATSKFNITAATGALTLQGNLSVNGGNVIIDTNKRTCFNGACTMYETFNGTCFITVTPTAVFNQC